MVVVVSRDTGRRYVTVAFITTAPNQPSAGDIVPIEGMDCSHTVKGVVRCDQLYLFDKEDRDWMGYVTTMSDADMVKVENGLRVALQIRG